MENKTEQFLSKGAVREMTALSDATLKRLEIAGDFPARRLVAGRRVAWLASEVTECVKAGEKVHQWPERKCFDWRGRENRGLASGRGSARGITPSLLQRITNVVEQRGEQSYPGSRGG